MLQDPTFDMAGRSPNARGRRCVQGAGARRGDAQAPAVGASTTSWSSDETVPVLEETVHDHAVRDAAALPQGDRPCAGSRRCWSSRRCRATSRRCCATPCARCCATTTSTSPTGTTCATCRSSAGRFGLDEYTQHLIDFLAAMGPGAHVLAVCQPCVAALAAVALMSEDDHPATPASLTLMAGPIDCRISPTEVNKLATSKPIEWFENNLISTRAVAPRRRRAARLSGLRAAVGVHEHEQGAPRQRVQGLLRRTSSRASSKRPRSRAPSTRSTWRWPTSRPTSTSRPCDVCSRTTRCRRASCASAAASSTRRRSAAPRC